MKICFWGDVDRALNGKTVGGAELQMALLARALAIFGMQVVIVDPEADKSYTTQEGIEVVSLPQWNTGIKGLRMFLTRIPLMWKLLYKQHADFYYVRTESYLHLIPYLVAKKLKSRFIHAIAHDLDLQTLKEKYRHKYRYDFNLIKYLSLQLPNDLMLYYLLKWSDFVLLQHAGQVVQGKIFRGKVCVFPNLIAFDTYPRHEKANGGYYIHVGTLTVLKGVDNLLQLIELLSRDIQVVIVGRTGDKTAQAIVEKLQEYPNVTYRGALDHQRTIHAIAGAAALISTSNAEGFPNVFLEAWATGTPVVSLKVDPGHVIQDYRLGVYCNDDLLKMKETLEAGASTQVDPSNFITYLRQFHDFTTAAERFVNLIRD